MTGSTRPIIHPNVVRDRLRRLERGQCFQYAFMRTGTGNGENLSLPAHLATFSASASTRPPPRRPSLVSDRAARDIWETLFIGREAYAVIELNAGYCEDVLQAPWFLGITGPARSGRFDRPVHSLYR